MEVPHALVGLPKEGVTDGPAFVIRRVKTPNNLPANVNGHRGAVRAPEVLRATFAIPQEGPAQFAWIVLMHTHDLSLIVDGNSFIVYVIRRA